MIKSFIALVSLFIVISLHSCNERPRDLIAINYKNDPSLSGKGGQVNDSTISYFPDSICTYEAYLDDIKNSMSYALYKMKEPLFYNSFLGKETYRIFWDQSLRPAIAIRIEFEHEIAHVTIKRLNRTIGYPFFPWGNPHLYNKEKSPQWNAREDNTNDSLVEVHNNCNYYNTIDSTFNLSGRESDSLINLISDCSFWETKPAFKLRMKIDGADWIIEGQNEYGYQVKLLTDLFNPNYTDRTQHKYEALCIYLLKKCRIKDKPQ